MYRFLFLTVLMLSAILINSMGTVQFPHAIQEGILLDHHASDLLLPGDEDDSGKNKSNFFEGSFLFVFLILSLRAAIVRNTAVARRYILLTPIFYQSNYVIAAPLNNDQ